MVEGRRLQISDLKVENNFIIPRFIVPEFLAAKRNFRQKGIGTALLRLVIDTAANHGMEQIHGILSTADSDDFPAIAEWLGEFGFNKFPPPKCVAFEAAWLFELALKPNT